MKSVFMALSLVWVMVAAGSIAGNAMAGPPWPGDAELDGWKADMVAACGAEAASVQIAHFDINEDGQPDTICLRNFKVATYGEFVDVAARVRNGNQEQRAYIILPVSAGVQSAVCTADNGFTIEETHWTLEDLAYVYDDPTKGRPVSITLAGSDCDPPWLFWPKDAIGEEVQFDFARM